MSAYASGEAKKTNGVRPLSAKRSQIRSNLSLSAFDTVQHQWWLVQLTAIVYRRSSLQSCVGMAPMSEFANLPVISVNSRNYWKAQAFSDRGAEWTILSLRY